MSNLDRNHGERIKAIIAKIKEEVPTSQSFADLLRACGSMTAMGERLGVPRDFLKRHRDNLFGYGVTLDYVMKYNEKASKIECRLIKTTTYKIVDMEQFLAGGEGTYAGLELVGVEELDETKRALDIISFESFSLSEKRRHGKKAPLKKKK